MFCSRVLGVTRRFSHARPTRAYATGGLSLTTTQRSLQIKDQYGAATLDAVLLRDGCTCAQCVDPDSGQKSFASTEVPLDIGIASARLTDHGIGVVFCNDMRADHETLVPWETVHKAMRRRPFERMAHPRHEAMYPKTGRRFWDRPTIQKRVRKLDYEDFMHGDALWQSLLDLSSLGLVFLKNVPHDPESITRITERIANIKSTFYGRTFDVRAKPNAENVAYTSGYLGLHQDLLYLSSPPAIQLLHCLENSCAGGESLFSDGLRAGTLLWLLQRDGADASGAVEALARVKVPYHYEKHGYFYQQERPLFHTAGPDGSLTNVFWSPPFQGQFQRPAADARPWLAAAQLFDGLINAEGAMYEVKMAPGECVLFDNLRVMHGRRAFDAAGGGSRWLRGAYIEREDVVSRVLHVPEDMAKEYRGNWARPDEAVELRASAWYDNVKQQLDEVATRLGASKMTEDDYRMLNGE